MKSFDFLSLYFITVILSICSALQLNHRIFSTPNHKASLTYPISTSPSDTWILLNTSPPANWVLINGAASIPFTLNGTVGISIDFSVYENGFYSLEIEVNCSMSNKPNHMTIDSIDEKRWAAGSTRCYSTFQKNINIGNFSFYLWAQSGLIINYISISPTIRKHPVYISLQNYPTQSILVLVTNISSTLADTNRFLQNTKVNLALKANIPI
jgi:hypothetical protein